MKRHIFKAAAFVAAFILLFSFTGCNKTERQEPTTSGKEVVVNGPPTEHRSVQLSCEEVSLIALITMAEAEGEPALGKRLVVDTILNRCDEDGFPDTVADVILQPNAFESVWNGRIYNCEPDSYIRGIVQEEAYSRTNTDVLYFNAEGYSDFGTPLFKVGNHYFSGK